MLITVSIGIGLKQVNKASSYLQNEKFLLQTTVIVDDALKLLQTSKELELIDSSETLALFLSEASIIPFEASGIKIILEISSARSKFNINSLIKPDNSLNQEKVDSLKWYVSNYMVNVSFVDILLDAMGKVKEDMSYNSDIFYEKPYLFRDYIVSYKHFSELSDFYTNSYHDNNLKEIDFKNLFHFSRDVAYKIDLNYATQSVWEMILGTDKLRAKELSLNSGAYASIEDLDLMDEEKTALARYETSFFEPFIDVVLTVIQDDISAEIRFEYDIENKKGSNFVYDI